MFPFRTSSIFRSRWMALLWAGGIIWTAINVAGSPPVGGGNQMTDATGTPVTPEQMKQTEQILENLGK